MNPETVSRSCYMVIIVAVFVIIFVAVFVIVIVFTFFVLVIFVVSLQISAFFLFSNFRKRQIALYSPCWSVGRSVDVTINFFNI